MKEMAAIFVAIGHGLIEVRIPSHKAEKSARRNSNIILLPGKF
jgi:hypothetical protein